MDEARAFRNAPRRGPGIAGSAALLLLAAFWLASAYGSLRPPADAARRPSRLGHLFDAYAPAVRLLGGETNAFLRLFGEQRGSARVVVARSRLSGTVLFLSEELDLERRQARARAQALCASRAGVLRGRLTALRAAGVARVVLVPVPTKFAVLARADPSIAADACADCDGSVTAEAYAALVRDLRTVTDASVADLHDLFVAETRAGHALYAPEDTHWTSYGLALAVREAIAAWRGRAGPDPVRVGTVPDVPGDLHRMLALPSRPSQRTHPIAQDRYAVPVSDGPCPPTLILLGSSYSRGPHPLADVLAQATGCPVVDRSEAGRAADAGVGPLLSAPGPPLRGAVVVWELPFRLLWYAEGFAP